MKIKKFGYIRISSKDQNEARQIESMKKAGIDDRDIFIDRQSGKDFERPQYQILKMMLREGDILYLHSLDRFGRNKEAILNEWNDITKEKGAHIVVLDMPLLDTTKYQDSLGTFISDLVLQILSWLAEEERNKIRTRQREGIDIALDQGRPYGRPKIEIDDAFLEVYTSWRNYEITGTQAYKALGMSKSTFYKRVREYEAKKPVTSQA